MATRIDFSQAEQENAHQLSDGDAREIVQLGVLNTESEDWQKLSPQRQQEILDEIAAKFVPRKQLIDEIKSKTQTGDEGGGNDEDGEEAGSENLDVPSSVKSAANAARSQVKSVFKTPNEQYISNFKQVIGKIPGYEPATLQDISDALYQSQDFTLRFISWLEKEAASDSLKLDTSGDPGLWPYTMEKTEFSSIQEKQEYIKNMLDGLKHAFEGKEAGAGMIEGVLLWILAGGLTAGVMVASAILVLKGSKWVLVKSLGAAGSAIVGVLEGVTGKTLSIGKTAAVKAGTAGVNAVRSRMQSPSAASGTAPTEHARELNLANNKLDAATSEAILRNIYNAERVAANLAPLADTAKLPTEWTPDSLSINNLNAYNLYHERIKQYLSLPDRPSDPTKLSEWKQELGRIIRGEVKPGTIWRPKWLGGTSASERADYTTNATARTDVAHKVMRSAVAEANVVEWTYGGLTVKLSGEMQPLTQELSVKEAEHTKKMKELQALVDEKARLEGLKRQLEKRMQEEITIESNAAEIKRLEGEIAKLNDATTGKVADTQTKVDAKNLEIAKHRETFKDPMGQIDGSKFDADSQTTKLKGELRALEGELAKHNRSLERLEKTLSDLESTQRQNITSYREKYRSSPRLSTVTADKLKGVGSAGTHGDGIEEKIKANEQVQQSKINELKRVWTEIKDIGVRMEATPKMAGKLNGLVVSDASIKTSIGGKEIEIKSLKGLTQKIMQIGAEAFKVGTKG